MKSDCLPAVCGVITPHPPDWVDEMRRAISDLLHIEMKRVGITVSTGDGLTDVGWGDGLQCFCAFTLREL